jgi:hypothetical protein
VKAGVEGVVDGKHALINFPQLEARGGAGARLSNQTNEVPLPYRAVSEWTVGVEGLAGTRHADLSAPVHRREWHH